MASAQNVCLLVLHRPDYFPLREPHDLPRSHNMDVGVHTHTAIAMGILNLADIVEPNQRADLPRQVYAHQQCGHCHV